MIGPGILVPVISCSILDTSLCPSQLIFIIVVRIPLWPCMECDMGHALWMYLSWIWTSCLASSLLCCLFFSTCACHCWKVCPTLLIVTYVKLGSKAEQATFEKATELGMIVAWTLAFNAHGLGLYVWQHSETRFSVIAYSTLATLLCPLQSTFCTGGQNL